MSKSESFIAQAKSWLGKKESDGSFKEIIDIYNEAARKLGLYIMKYVDPWCAAFVTACAWKCGLTDIVAQSASCDAMISWYKKRDCWKDRDYTPKSGDIVFYDWDSNNTSDHVGIIESVSGNTAVVIEGNHSDSVARRVLNTNSNYIIGYGVPKYDDSTTVVTPSIPVVVKPSVEVNNLVTSAVTLNCIVKLPTLKYGCGMSSLKAYKPWVKTMQCLLINKNYSCGGTGKDGEFGPATETAVRNFQTENHLVVDGVCGNNTWNKLMEG